MSPDFKSEIVVTCPTCKRPMWAWGLCSHGQVPTTREGAPKEDAIEEDRYKRRGGPSSSRQET